MKRAEVFSDAGRSLPRLLDEVFSDAGRSLPRARVEWASNYAELVLTIVTPVSAIKVFASRTASAALSA